MTTYADIVKRNLNPVIESKAPVEDRRSWCVDCHKQCVVYLKDDGIYEAFCIFCQLKYFACAGCSTFVLYDDLLNDYECSQCNIHYCKKCVTFIEGGEGARYRCGHGELFF